MFKKLFQIATTVIAAPFTPVIAAINLWESLGDSNPTIVNIDEIDTSDGLQFYDINNPYDNTTLMDIKDESEALISEGKIPGTYAINVLETNTQTDLNNDGQIAGLVSDYPKLPLSDPKNSNSLKQLTGSNNYIYLAGLILLLILNK